MPQAFILPSFLIRNFGLSPSRLSPSADQQKSTPWTRLNAISRDARRTSDRPTPPRQLTARSGAELVQPTCSSTAGRHATPWHRRSRRQQIIRGAPASLEGDEQRTIPAHIEGRTGDGSRLKSGRSRTARAPPSAQASAPCSVSRSAGPRAPEGPRDARRRSRRGRR